MTSLPDSDHSTAESAGSAAQTGLADGQAVSVSLAEKVIERFGGIRPMASKLEVPVTTVQGWKKRGAIPPTRLNDLRAAARRHNIRIEEHEIEALGRAEDRRFAGGALRPLPGAEDGPDHLVPVAATPPLPRTPEPQESAVAAPAAESTAPVETPAVDNPAVETAVPAEPAARAESTVGESTAGESARPTLEPAVVPEKAPAVLVVTPADNPAATLPAVVASLVTVAPAAPVAPAAVSATAAPVEAPADPAKSGAAEGELAIPPLAIPRFEVPPPRVPWSADTGDRQRSTMPVPVGSSRRTSALEARDGAAETASHATSDRWAWIAVAAAVVALIGAAVAVMVPMWSTTPATPVAAARSYDRRIAEIENKIGRESLEQIARSTNQERRVDGVEARITETAQSNAALVTKLSSRMDELVARLEDRISDDEKALADRVAEIKATFEDLNQKLLSQPVGGSPRLAMLLSATQLRNVLVTAHPFQSELAAVKLAGFVDSVIELALSQIAGQAARGIATQAWLIDRFRDFSGNIILAGTAGQPVERVFDQLTGALALFAPPLYRLTGIPEGDSVRAIVERAEDHLAAGNLQKAYDQLSKLTGAALEEAGPWLAEARNRLAAERARTLLNVQMVQLMASPTGAAPTR